MIFRIERYSTSAYPEMQPCEKAVRSSRGYWTIELTSLEELLELLEKNEKTGYLHTNTKDFRPFGGGNLAEAGYPLLEIYDT